MSIGSPIPLTTLDKQEFVAYHGPEGRVFLERVRASGRRNAKSIFEFELLALLDAVTPPGLMS